MCPFTLVMSSRMKISLTRNWSRAQLHMFRVVDTVQMSSLLLTELLAGITGTVSVPRTRLGKESEAWKHQYPIILRQLCQTPFDREHWGPYEKTNWLSSQRIIVPPQSPRKPLCGEPAWIPQTWWSASRCGLQWPRCCSDQQENSQGLINMNRIIYMGK